jgi:hypothetical protein
MLNKDSESAFSMVQDLLDNNINKPMLLDACEAHFFEKFKKSQSKDVIDNCILANRLMLQLTPTEIMAPGKFLDYYRVKLRGRNEIMGDMKKLVGDLHCIENVAFDIHQ